MQASELLDYVLAGPEVQVVRVAEDNRGPCRAQLLGIDVPHRPARPDRHERRSRHVAVRGAEHARASCAVGGEHAKVRNAPQGIPGDP